MARYCASWPAQFRLPSGKHLLKVSPLADWTNADVWAYLKRRGVPVLPLDAPVEVELTVEV